MKDFALTTSLAIVAVFTPIHAVLIVVGGYAVRIA
jgi:hypothetical protein